MDQILPDSYSYYGDSRAKQVKLIARLGLALKEDHRLSPTLFLNRENAKLLKGYTHNPAAVGTAVVSRVGAALLRIGNLAPNALAQRWRLFRIPEVIHGENAVMPQSYRWSRWRHT